MLRFKLLPGLAGPLLAVLLVVSLPASPANGSIVQGLELRELVTHADRIILGRVLFSESFQRADGQLGTWHRIEVEREIRGGASDEREVIVETMGGQIGDIAMRVEGEPSFSVGERVLVFVRDGGPYTAFRPVGMGHQLLELESLDDGAIGGACGEANYKKGCQERAHQPGRQLESKHFLNLWALTASVKRSGPHVLD